MFYFKAYIMSFWGPAQELELLVLYQYYYSPFHMDISISTDFGLQIVQGNTYFKAAVLFQLLLCQGNILISFSFL